MRVGVFTLLYNGERIYSTYVVGIMSSPVGLA